MLKKTYDKVCELFEEGNGYLPTRTLLNNCLLYTSPSPRD